jgi:hypothetical protein
MGIFPMALATSFPVESIAPDPPPPKRIRALGTTAPLGSYACAENCTVSPARTVRVAGVITMREIALGCACDGAGAPC